MIGKSKNPKEKNHVKKDKDDGMIHKLTQAFITVLDSVNIKISLDELIDKFSKEVDKVILETIKKENLIYISGELNLDVKDDYIDIVAKYYFNDQNGEWVVKQSTKKVSLDRIDISTIEENHMSFEIESPVK